MIPSDLGFFTTCDFDGCSYDGNCKHCSLLILSVVCQNICYSIVVEINDIEYAFNISVKNL